MGVGAFQHLEDPLQASSQAPRVQELSVDRLQPGGDRVLQREPVALERAGDPRERHAEGAERHDLIQPADVGLGVAPVAGLGPLRGPHEPDLVVVVQRANGEPGAVRELADPQAVVGRGLLHGGTVRPDATWGSTTRQ